MQLELQLWQIEVEVSAYLPAGHPVDNTQVKVDDIRKYWVGPVTQEEQLVEDPKHVVHIELQVEQVFEEDYANVPTGQLAGSMHEVFAE